MKKIIVPLLVIILQFVTNTYCQTKGCISLPSSPSAIAVQSDGKTLLGLSKDEDTDMLIRLNSDGQQDNSFKIGFANSIIYDICCLPSGKILIAGAFSTFNSYSYRNIVRLNSDGTIDYTFKKLNENITQSFILSTIFIQRDNKIIIAGKIQHEISPTKSLIGILRLNSDGTIDETFCKNLTGGFWEGRECLGALSDEQSSALYRGAHYVIMQQEDGKLIVGAPFERFHALKTRSLVRLNLDGSIDTTFHPNLASYNYSSVMEPSVSFRGCCLRRDGKILLSGEFSSVDNMKSPPITLLQNSGRYDPSFDNIKKLNLEIDYSQQIFYLEPSGTTIMFSRGTKTRKSKYGIVSVTKDYKLEEGFLETNSNITSNLGINNFIVRDNKIYATGFDKNKKTSEDNVFFILDLHGNLVLR